MDFKLPSAGWIAAILLGILLIVALWMSYYTVGPESQGVVRRFGKYLQTVDPGLHFKLPFGIDMVTVLPTRRQLKLEFGFSRPSYPTNPIQADQEPDEGKSMVTGDLNAALLEWVVQYRIEDPGQNMIHLNNRQQTLSDSAFCVKEKVLEDRTADALITIGRQDIEIEALARMQE